jgi:taurine-pyruvate aminotransferase
MRKATACGCRRDRGGDPARGSGHGRRPLPRTDHRGRRRHHPAAEGYWERVQEICAKYDILLHIDEVVCGVGRTGQWFGYQHYGIKPDFVTMAKGVASGYAAISCTVTTEAVFEQFKDDPSDPMSYFRDISTFGGCAAGPAAALENMRIIEDEDLIENTRQWASG